MTVDDGDFVCWSVVSVVVVVVGVDMVAGKGIVSEADDDGNSEFVSVVVVASEGNDDDVVGEDNVDIGRTGEVFMEDCDLDDWNFKEKIVIIMNKSY